MKIFQATAAMLLAFTLTASAQVSVEVLLDQEQYLPGETLTVATRIVNRSGQTLRLGDDPDWLTFSVESRDGFVVAQSGNVPVQGAFELESSKMGTKRVDIAPHFEMNQPGRYTVTAQVKIKQWDSSVSSRAKSFDIIRGTTLWEQEFGVPLSPGTTGQPEVRRYALLQANYHRELRLYVRVTDDSGALVYRVFPLGQMVSFGRPEPQVDKLSNLHVLCQSGARTYNYAVVNPDGAIVMRQTHEIADTRPRLHVDESGIVLVTGGQRRVTSTDLPTPEVSSP